eukprot:COSAG06_NODE_6291_length_2995_cov_95.512605_3_plen_58_part_00
MTWRGQRRMRQRRRPRRPSKLSCAVLSCYNGWRRHVSMWTCGRGWLLVRWGVAWRGR